MIATSLQSPPIPPASAKSDVLAIAATSVSGFGSILKDKLSADAHVTYSQAATSDAKPTESPRRFSISPEASRPHTTDKKVAFTTQGNPLLNRDMREFANMLHGNQETAAKVAKVFAYEDHNACGNIGGLLDYRGTEPGGDGIIRYQDGTPVTEESKTYFVKEEARFRRERINIYESEMAKGTPPADIYDKLMAALDSQPARYRMMMGWPVSDSQS